MSIRVLVADPERELLDAYRDYLQGQDFEVETTSGGPQCVRMLLSWRPDVLVLEPDMPGGWGQKILDTVRENPTIRGVPVLILSRRDGTTVEYPVREYHVKPFSLAKLACDIREAVTENLAEFSDNGDQ